MAISTNWEIKIGTVASPTNFTSRVMSMSINQQVDVNVIGRGICQITLLNKDGALTPGGGGTYSSTDWFAQGVFVSTTITSTSTVTKQVFHGIITDFDLQDNGVYSTVTITAVDGLTVGGRTLNGQYAFGVTVPYSVAVTAGLDTYGADYPRLGASTDTATWTNLGDATPNVTTSTTTFASAADLWQTALIPSTNDVLWATTITGTTTATYNVVSIPESNSRTVANRHDMEFDPPASLSGSKLPFDIDAFEQGFNNDTLITTAQIKGLYAGATTTTQTAATLTSYGNRTVSFLSTFVADATAAETMASRLANRYGNSRFTPISLSTSATLVKRLAADAAHSKWASLLSIEQGLWQRVKITWTGSGVASQIAYCVIKGRQINVTPDDTVVTLILGNWADNHAFILDTDQLNTDRLG